VDVRGDVLLPHERSRCAGRDGDVGAARELEELERVPGRLVERLVARDGRDPEQLDLRARERQQKRDCVVVPRIAVDEDLRRDAGTLGLTT
jgi:hypothetical protein